MKKLTARKYPSTMSLRCFEASARYLSFTKAAQALHMTQSAVSKQVAQLEETLSSPLFHRSLPRLQLTPTGKLFLQETQAILSQIERSVLNLLAHGSEAETLYISAHPTLCARWLIATLKGFGCAHPNIHLDVREQIGSYDVDLTQVDLAFLYGDGVWPEMSSIKLFDEHCVAVCTPALLAQPVAHLAQLKDYVLIQSRSRPRAWDEFFHSQQVMFDETFFGPRFDTFYACIHAAQAGCGIALIPKFLVARELAAQELVLAWPYEMVSQGAYYMAYPSVLAPMDKIQIMIQWIQNHLVSDMRVD